MIAAHPILKVVSAILVSSCCCGLAAEGVKVSLVRELLKARTAQLSPDGKKICFMDWSRKDAFPFRIVDIETGATLFNRFFKSYRTVSFAGNNHLLVREGIPGNKNEKLSELSLIDFYSNERTGRILLDRNPYLNSTILPIGSQRLLAIQYDPVPSMVSSLSLVEFPGLREIAKEPYAIEPRLGMTKIGGMSLSNNFDLEISAQGSILAYSYDYTLLCRSAEDLGILWKQKMTPPLKAHDLAISAGGDYVAAFATNSQWIPDQSEKHIFIYDGKTGALKSRTPFAGAEGFTISPSGNTFDISPDGKLLAVVHVQREGNEWAIKINIYSSSSGERLASILHDRIGNADKTKLPAYTNVHFSSDGRFLVTTGINTKIWRIE